MRTFETPEPITAVIDLGTGAVRVAGELRIVASARADTVVDVRPADLTREADAEAADGTIVEYAGGRLVVRAPRRRRLRGLLGSPATLLVTVELPEDSRVVVKAASADLRCEGRLGESRIETADGDVAVARTAGHTVVTSANGDVRVDAIDGTAVIKTSNGDIAVGEVTGDLRLSTANGDISVDRALASVVAKTANGGVRVGEVVSGAVVMETASGSVELGVREGTAALLDVGTASGAVHSSLEAADGPAPSDETVTVRARTATGDIVIRRAS